MKARVVIGQERASLYKLSSPSSGAGEGGWAKQQRGDYDGLIKGGPGTRIGSVGGH
jgi:hypothetical protein